MTNTITRVDTSVTTVPLEVLGYQTERRSRNIVHDLLDGSVAVSLIDSAPRNGTLSLFYDTEATALAGMNLHSYRTTYTLVSTELTSINMTYVVDGGVTLRFEETRKHWVVEVGYQEVIA